TRARRRAPPPADRGPRCSRRRTVRGRAPAPRRGPVGRSPWPHRRPREPRRQRKLSHYVQRWAWPPPVAGGRWGGVDDRGSVMGFNGEAFVEDLREELQASGRTLDRAVWVEKVVQGDATKEDLVGWARQHYWGVTYHTRRFL